MKQNMQQNRYFKSLKLRRTDASITYDYSKEEGLREFHLGVCGAKFCLNSRQLLLYLITQNLQKNCIVELVNGVNSELQMKALGPQNNVQQVNSRTLSMKKSDGEPSESNFLLICLVSGPSPMHA